MPKIIDQFWWKIAFQTTNKQQQQKSPATNYIIAGSCKNWFALEKMHANRPLTTMMKPDPPLATLYRPNQTPECKNMHIGHIINKHHILYAKVYSDLFICSNYEIRVKCTQ